MSNVAASSPRSADKPEKAAGSPEVSALRPSPAGAVSGYCVGIAVRKRSWAAFRPMNHMAQATESSRSSSSSCKERCQQRLARHILERSGITTEYDIPDICECSGLV